MNAHSDEPSTGPTHLVAIRRTARRSQELLAEQAGISLRTLRNIELGAVSRPHRHTLEHLAAALDLDPVDAETFVGFWYPEPHRHEMNVPDLLRPSLEDYLTPEQLRTKNAWTALARRSSDVYDAHRALVSSEVDEVIRADRDDVRHASMLIYRGDGQLDWDGLAVTHTRGCVVVGATVIPEFEVKVFDIEFEVCLRAGEVFRWGVTTSNGPPLAPYDPRTGRIGLGATRAGSSLTQEVRFSDDARPTNVAYRWSSHAMRGRELGREELSLNSLNSTMFHLPAAPVGVHEIAWDW
jgi:transcriptional regulator with XRE-family HTH domain